MTETHLFLFFAPQACPDVFARWEKSKDLSQAVLKIKGRGGGGQKNKEKKPSKKRKVEEEDEEKEKEKDEDEGESVVNDKEEEEQQQQGKVQSRDVANKTKVSGAKEGSVEKKRKTVEKKKKATPKETDGGGPDGGVGGDEMKVLVVNDEAAPLEMEEEHEQKQESKQESKREQSKSAGRKNEAANENAVGIRKKRARAGGAPESVGLVEEGVAGGVLEERGEKRNGIRIGDKMKGKYKSTPGWYGCKVVAMAEEGKWVVEWDDGDEEDTVKDPRHLRQ
jgi:hypothetical protein